MDGLSTAANIFGAIELTGKIVKICGRYITEVKNARDDIITLQRSAAGLEDILLNLKKLFRDHGSKLSVSSNLAENINDCISDLEALETKINPGHKKGVMRKFGIRALKWPIQRPEVDRFVENLERYKSSFILSMQVDQTVLLTDVAQSLDSTKEILNLDKLPVARGAEFDSYLDQHEDECLTGTRIEIIRQVTEWARSAEGKCILWLNGMAGTGKSTISRTVARSFKEAELLGASFFFKRGEADRGNAMKIFSTIIRQLVIRIPQLALGIQKTLDEEPEIASKSLKEQFDKLVLRPIQSADHLQLLSSNVLRNSAIIIVIDALDECARDEDIRAILRLLPILQGSNTIRLRVFLTSRPELPIRLGFTQMPDFHYQCVVLDQVPEPVIQHDISLFLKHRLSKIRTDRDLPGDWPGDIAIQSLVKMSIPLFIFAATACRILEDHQWDPEESLAKLLAYQNDESEADPSSRFDDMSQFDKTYLPVLNRLLEGQSKKQERQLVQEFHDIVGTIATLEISLSVTTLSKLLGFSEKQIDRRLSSLHSVLSIPLDHNQPVRLFHLSFRDFLLDSETQDRTPFWVDEAKVHQRLTTRCLQICGGLKKNMCGLEWGTRRAEIDSQIIDRCLPSEVQYSCRYWAYHLSRSKEYLVGSENRLSCALSFLQQHCLHWMEAMGILGLTSEVIGIISLLQLSFTPRENTYHLGRARGNVELSEFLQDARRFFLKNGPLIDDVPLQIYCSGLIFAPKGSILRTKFENEAPHWIHGFPDIDKAWSAELLTLEGHSGSVHSVAFGPDGCLASGSGDEVVRLWDSSTGSLQQSLEGHSDRVHSVAFSTDGSLATGSADNTVKIWDSSSGLLRQTLEGHSDWVNSVAFSPDGKLLASGSDDESVKLWNPFTGDLRQNLQGHCGRVQAVAFSSHGVLASSSGDETIMLWDSNTGVLRHTLKGHSDWVKSVTFSPDGCLLASGSYDKTVKIWNPSTGLLLQTLEAHWGWVYSVAFGSDGRFLASASKDKTVRIWDPTSGALLRTLEGHSGPVLSVVISSCGQILATGSYDKTVKLWDSVTGTSQQQDIEGHSDWVYSVSFSPDGRKLASGSRDATVKLWDSFKRVVQRTLHGHSMSVRAVLFSPDGKLLASGSYDKTIRIWDSTTGVEQRVLEGHASRIRSIAFSPNSRLLASISNDEMLILWDSSNGASLQRISRGNILSLTLEPFQNGSYMGIDLNDANIRSWFQTHGSIWPRKEDKIWIENDQWVMFLGNKTVWLPLEYRPSCSTAQGYTIALGHASGRVSFMEYATSNDWRRKQLSLT